MNMSSAATPDSELCHNHCSVTNTIPRTEATNVLKHYTSKGPMMECLDSTMKFREAVGPYILGRLS